MDRVASSDDFVLYMTSHLRRERFQIVCRIRATSARISRVSLTHQLLGDFSGVGRTDPADGPERFSARLTSNMLCGIEMCLCV